MARNSTPTQWIAAGVLSLAVLGTAWTSFSTSGLQLESSGIKMTMKVSLDRGLVVKFAGSGR